LVVPLRQFGNELSQIAVTYRSLVELALASDFDPLDKIETGVGGFWQ
jgi:hypothetical protein